MTQCPVPPFGRTFRTDVCNGYHRYGKQNCPSHRIREYELDEIIYGEIRNVKHQAEQLYKIIDGEVRRWLKKKSTVTGKIRQLTAALEQKKSDQKEILLERIRDKAHADVYDEMLTSCESDIKRIEQELYDIEHYSETIKKRKAEMKRTVDLIDQIISEGQISDANLRQLVDKILIYDTGDGLRIQVDLKANFTEHMIVFNDLGEQSTDLRVKWKYDYPPVLTRGMIDKV